ncbi:MAG: GNAT family N-acetyltransferase [Hyphomicrobiales bacterium]
MQIIIKKTPEEHYFTTEKITREAFWNLYKPGCDEHLVLHNLRNSNAYIDDLDLIALTQHEISGHIISTRAIIKDEANNEYEVLCTGPISVLPSMQSKGIGSMLLRHSIEKAKELGYSGIILFGNPNYYQRFGFRNAEIYKITTKDGQNFDPFMALELKENSLENIKGSFFEAQEFTIKKEELNEFDKNFPYKEKKKTDTQL